MPGKNPNFKQVNDKYTSPYLEASRMRLPAYIVFNVTPITRVYTWNFKIMTYTNKHSQNKEQYTQWHCPRIKLFQSMRDPGSAGSQGQCLD